MRALVRVIQQEEYTYADPITQFIECLYVHFDFERAQQKLRECEVALQSDYFLAHQSERVMEDGRRFIFETYSRIHQKIDIPTLADKLGMELEGAERWIVDLIRGALLDFDADDGEQLCAAAMDRTSRLLNAPHVVRSEARKMANRGTCIHAVVSEIVTKWSAGPVRKRRWIYLACAIWSSLVLASILQVMSFFMRLGMAIGVDFTTGMKNQRMSKRRWALRKTPTSTVELARMRSLVRADASTAKGDTRGDDEKESGRRSPDENVAPNGFAVGGEQRSRANRKFLKF